MNSVSFNFLIQTRKERKVRFEPAALSSITRPNFSNYRLQLVYFKHFN